MKSKIMTPRSSTNKPITSTPPNTITGITPKTNILKEIQEVLERVRKTGEEESFVRYVNPAEATDILNKNSELQRDKSKTHVSGLGNKMDADPEKNKFVLTPDGIGIDRNGHLCNGQHRLQALAQQILKNPGMKQKFVFVIGLPPENIKFFDQGLKRKPDAVLQTHGIIAPDHTASAVRMFYLYQETGMITAKTNTDVYGPDDLIKFMTDNKLKDGKYIVSGKGKKMIEAMQQAHVIYPKANFLTRSHWGFLIYLLTKCDPDKGPLFVERLATGARIDSSGKYSPIYHLRNWLIDNPLVTYNTKKKRGATNVTALTIRFKHIARAWNSFIDNRSISELKLGTEEYKDNVLEHFKSAA